MKEMLVESFNEKVKKFGKDDLPEDQCPDDPINKRLTIDYFKQPLNHFDSKNQKTWEQVRLFIF
jgi:hypothetical protein